MTDKIELPPLPVHDGLTLTAPDKHRVCELLVFGVLHPTEKTSLYTGATMERYVRARIEADRAARTVAAGKSIAEDAEFRELLDASQHAHSEYVALGGDFGSGKKSDDADERLIAHIDSLLTARTVADVPAEPSKRERELDAALDQAMGQRDKYHEWADILADNIAMYFKADIGEHSNQNCPWAEALEVIESAINEAAPTAPVEQAARTASAAPSELEQRLREYAADPGYSHNDYADTMRQAADALAALASQPSALQEASDSGLPEEMEQRTEEIRLRSGFPHTSRKQLAYDVECLLAHIAMMRAGNATELKRLQILAGCMSDDLWRLHAELDLPEAENFDVEDMIDAIQELKAFTVPEGCVLAPIDPTEDMVIMGFESAPSEGFTPIDEWEEYEAMSGCQQAAHRARLCYAAMLAAAPAPAAVPQAVAVPEDPRITAIYKLRDIAERNMDAESASIISGAIADLHAPPPPPESGELAKLREAVEAVSEGSDILADLMDSIKKHGNYSQEGTLTFLGQLQQCLNECRAALPQDLAKEG